MDYITLVFAPVFFVVYMSIVFVLPSVRTYRKTGVRPVTFAGTDSAHDFIGKWFKIILAIIPVVLIAFIAGNNIYQFTMPATILSIVPVQIAGIVLCCISFVWTAIAQFQMGRSWRIGIDEQHPTELVKKGLFSISRNPIFLGMLVTLAGYFLLLPNGLTFTVLVSGYLLIQIQTRMEEEFLRKQHGPAYTEYETKVKRFL